MTGLFYFKYTIMSETNFIDYVKILFKSGHGGAGSVHMRRIKYFPLGGPDGGNGGKGGSIILKGNKQLWTLLHLKYTKHIYAKDGAGGTGDNSTGANGPDIIVEVPLGTIAKNPETEEKIIEITEHGQQIVLMPGGRGGMGNAYFKTATHRTPRFAQPGGEGQEDWVVLELKVLADVGLVGFPNAGKSTLLASVTAAKPKIANYPFTTLVPNLGIVKYHGDSSFVMADIPGIIEGAHEGKGLGLRFLRHIERNSVLLFMIPIDSPSIKKEYKILLNELEKYNPELLDKTRILTISKIDTADEALLRNVKKKLPDVDTVFISSVTGEGLDVLKKRLWTVLNDEA